MQRILSIIDNYIVGAVSFFCAKFAVTNIVFTFCNLLQYKVYEAKKTKYLYFVLEVAGVLISVSYSCSYHIFDIFYFYKYIGFPYRYIFSLRNQVFIVVLEVAGVLISVSYPCSYHIFST